MALADLRHRSFVPWGHGLGSLPALNAADGRIPMISFGGADPRAVATGPA